MGLEHACVEVRGDVHDAFGNGGEGGLDEGACALGQHGVLLVGKGSTGRVRTDKAYLKYVIHVLHLVEVEAKST
jgi:hypothetical protein